MTLQPPFHVYIGWDVREMRAWNVAQLTLRQRALDPQNVLVHRIAMPQLRACGLYTRPTQEKPGGGYLDRLSAREDYDGSLATGHAIARFLVPYLAGYAGSVLFVDGDVLFRDDVARLFALGDPQYAVQVVQHHHAPTHTEKMDGQTQTRYLRKNWSSVMLFHCGHPANRALTVDLVNTVPGRDLHRFCWLEDGLIGALPARWNVLVDVEPYDVDAAMVHFTEGVPDMPGYEHVAYADEWYAAAKGCGYRLPRPALDLQVPA